jgi:hypothetical protein
VAGAVAVGPAELESEVSAAPVVVVETQLCLHLKICRRQLYNWRVRGLLPYFKIGKAVRFRVADVVKALEDLRIGK